MTHASRKPSGTDRATAARRYPARLAVTTMVLAAGLGLSALAGCGTPGANVATRDQSAQAAKPADPGAVVAPEPATPSAAVAEYPALEPSEKRALIAQNFPVEVPVAAGTVVRGQAQGDSAWDYEITCTLGAADLAQWYLMAYQGRAWQLIHEERGRTDTGRDFIELELGKGFSQSRLTIVDEGAQSRVTAVLGLGEAVLESQ